MKKNKLKQAVKKGRTQIILKSEKGQSLNLREVEDIQTGKMSYAIPVEVITKKKSFTLVYDITNYITIEQYVYTIMNRRKYIGLLLQILGVFQKMTDDYYNPQNLVLELDKVLVNPSTDHIRFLFVPILYYNHGIPIRDFLLQLIYRTTFDSSEDTSYVGRCVEILQKNRNFSIAELEEYLKLQFSEKSSTGIYCEETVPSEKEYHPFSDAREKRADSVMQKEQPLRENRNRTGILSGSGIMETVLLGAEETKPCFKQIRTGKSYYLKQERTKIGKRKCDITIEDNSAVSKEHAMIQEKDDIYYICDLNSTNGTKLNGRKIPAMDQVRLSDEDEIELANEKFIFYL